LPSSVRSIQTPVPDLWTAVRYYEHLFVIHRPLFVIYEHLFVICKPLFVIYEHLFVICKPLFVIYEHLFAFWAVHCVTSR